jgi:hypothetical protein
MSCIHRATGGVVPSLQMLYLLVYAMLHHFHDCKIYELILVVYSRAIVSDVMLQREIMRPPDEGVAERNDHEGFTRYITWCPPVMSSYYHLPFTESILYQFKMSHVSRIIRP